MVNKSGQAGIRSHSIHKVSLKQTSIVEDQIAIEEPLLIQLSYPGVESEDLVITMHTPVHTEDLVRGFLYTEGAVERLDQLLSIHIDQQSAMVKLSDAPIKKADRGTVSTAACGMCGKTSLEALQLVRSFDLHQIKQRISSPLLLQMDTQMRQHQTLFSKTGGIHAAALFDFDGDLVSLREDIGRHNAVDKAIGQMLSRGLDKSQMILFVSGRAGFELVQKALVSGISMMVAVGAPSSLAVQYAQENGMTLIGFMQKERFNVYTHPERVG